MSKVQLLPDEPHEQQPPFENTTADTETQIEQLHKELRRLQLENAELKTKLKNSTLDKAAFRNNDEKVLAYTGLPSYALLMVVFDTISEHLPCGENVSPFQKLLLTLMKLKLNVSNAFLATMFSVVASTCSRYIQQTIHVLNAKFVPMALHWPPSSHVIGNLPQAFQVLYPRCVSIIDCFEIFIDRPAALDQRASTYSNYKSHNTIKYLISVTPRGFVNFVSLGWGGRASDRHVTENSDYLKYLKPKDQVLADRGFNIEDVIALRGASLSIPAFTRGKSQLSSEEVASTRTIASVRIHVERVIGNVRKKYPILNSTVNLTFLRKDNTTNITTLDKMVRVCCALTNICETIVPK